MRLRRNQLRQFTALIFAVAGKRHHGAKAPA